MSDELIVCIVILILSAIITAIAIIYICALLAITKTEEYQKNEGRGGNYGDAERNSNQDNRRDSDRDG